jgi:hypothetical protein
MIMKETGRCQKCGSTDIWNNTHVNYKYRTQMTVYVKWGFSKPIE